MALFQLADRKASLRDFSAERPGCQTLTVLRESPRPFVRLPSPWGVVGEPSPWSPAAEQGQQNDGASLLNVKRGALVFSATGLGEGT